MFQNLQWARILVMLDGRKVIHVSSSGGGFKVFRDLAVLGSSSMVVSSGP